MRIQRTLKLGGGEHGVLCAVKHNKERVALTIDHLSAEEVERPSKQSSVIRKNALVRIAERREQLRGALDVREEKRDGPGWELSHVQQSFARLRPQAKL
jgi:hypothetical protein